MTEKWIGLPAVTDVVRTRTGLTIGAANQRAIEAFAAGVVRTRWEAFAGERGSGTGTRPPIPRHAWGSADIPEPDLMISADGTRRRGITVNEGDLLAWLDLQTPSSTTIAARSKGGRPPAADWEAIGYVLELEVQKRGQPCRDNERGWRTQADVERWVASLLEERKETVGESTIRDRVRDLLKRNEAEK